MKRYRIIAGLLMMLCLLLVGCASESAVPVATVPGADDIVGVTIYDNGISVDKENVLVGNFCAGNRAEMVYRIHNATSKVVRPKIYTVEGADVAGYSKSDGAVPAVQQVLNWIELPELRDIAPGATEDFIVAVAMPEEEKKPTAKKVGFQIGVSGDAEKNVQTAIGVWWLITMR